MHPNEDKKRLPDKEKGNVRSSESLEEDPNVPTIQSKSRNVLHDALSSNALDESALRNQVEDAMKVIIEMQKYHSEADAPAGFSAMAEQKYKELVETLKRPDVSEKLRNELLRTMAMHIVQMQEFTPIGKRNSNRMNVTKFKEGKLFEEYQVEEDGWEVIGIKHDKDRDQVMLAVWKPEFDKDLGCMWPTWNPRGRHQIEGKNDLSWMREYLSNIPDDMLPDAKYLRKEFGETVEDKARRQWVEKRRALQKFKESWENTPAEILERDTSPVIDKYASGAKMWMHTVAPMTSKITSSHSPAHEQFIFLCCARDFYWHMSERLEDKASKDQYTKKTQEMRDLAKQYEQFIAEKTAK